MLLSVAGPMRYRRLLFAAFADDSAPRVVGDCVGHDVRGFVARDVHVHGPLMPDYCGLWDIDASWRWLVVNKWQIRFRLGSRQLVNALDF